MVQATESANARLNSLSGMKPIQTGTFQVASSSTYVGKRPPGRLTQKIRNEVMTMNTNDVIKTMNDLIETSRDGEQGFRTCASY